MIIPFLDSVLDSVLLPTPSALEEQESTLSDEEAKEAKEAKEAFYKKKRQYWILVIIFGILSFLLLHIWLNGPTSEEERQAHIPTRDWANLLPAWRQMLLWEWKLKDGIGDLVLLLAIALLSACYLLPRPPKSAVEAHATQKDTRNVSAAGQTQPRKPSAKEQAWNALKKAVENKQGFKHFNKRWGPLYKDRHEFRDEHGLQIVLLTYGLLMLLWPVHFEENYVARFWHEFCHEVGLALTLAAIVSYVFDVAYHEKVFGSPVKGINHSVKELKDTSVGLTKQSKVFGEQVGTLSKDISELNSLQGFFAYRRVVREAYRMAQKRIISVADYWIIDAKWWDNSAGDAFDVSATNMVSSVWWNDAFWKASPLYQTLLPHEGREQFPEAVIFVGKMPWPEMELRMESVEGRDPAHCVKTAFKDPQDFQRFLGVVWRFVIADMARKEWKRMKNHDVHIRVVAASLPYSPTVVDNDVFMLLETPDKVFMSRGAQLTTSVRGMEEGKKEEKLARNAQMSDEYARTIIDNIHNAPSVRECIESIILTAFQVAKSEEFHPAEFVLSVSTIQGMRRALNVLGMQEWIVWENDQNKEQDPRNLTEKNLENCAMNILHRFWETLGYIDRESTSNPNARAASPELAIWQVQDDLL